jgi:hypothetical protein
MSFSVMFRFVLTYMEKDRFSFHPGLSSHKQAQKADNAFVPFSFVPFPG